MITPGAHIIRGNRGRKGRRGLSVYEVWLGSNNGTETEFLDDLRSKIPGRRGPVGYSIFEQWNIDRINRGESVGTHDCFIFSIMTSYFGVELMGDVHANKIGVIESMLDLNETNLRQKALTRKLCCTIKTMHQMHCYAALKRFDIQAGIIGNAIDIAMEKVRVSELEAAIWAKFAKQGGKLRCMKAKLAAL